MNVKQIWIWIPLIALCSAIALGEAPQNSSSQPADHSKYLRRSGVAYDAMETLYGLIKITNPRSFFRPTTKQVTWWGEFKPFSSWARPNLQAHWIDPEGRMVMSQNFEPEECRLAKVTLIRPTNVELKEGRWQVDISMDGKPIDQKNFVVFNPSRQPVTTTQTQDVRIDSSQTQDRGTPL